MTWGSGSFLEGLANTLVAIRAIYTESRTSLNAVVCLLLRLLALQTRQNKVRYSLIVQQVHHIVVINCVAFLCCPASLFAALAQSYGKWLVHFPAFIMSLVTPFPYNQVFLCVLGRPLSLD